MKKLFTVLFAIILIFSLNKAQSLSETLSSLSSSAGSAYVEPIISAFGSNLNAGWVSAAPPASRFEFDLGVKFVGVGSFFSDDQKRLNTNGSFSFTTDQIDMIIQGATSGLQPGSAEYNNLKNYMLTHNNWSVEFSGPTIIGSENEYLQVTFPGQEINGVAFGEYDLILEEVKGYLDELPALPSVAAQLNVGTIMGTQVSFRWFPDMDVKDLGKFKFFGFGILHNPEVWFNDPLPIDIAAGFFTQTMKVGDIFESTATQYGVWISKKFGEGVSISPYIGLTMETSNTDVAYDYTFSGPGGIEETAHVSFELDGQNKSGLTVGANLELIFIDLSLDYKISKTNTASLGLSFGL